jgi:hypothetical protein
MYLTAMFAYKNFLVLSNVVVESPEAGRIMWVRREAE